jgi:hypothetical protein
LNLLAQFELGEIGLWWFVNLHHCYEVTLIYLKPRFESSDNGFEFHFRQRV